LEQAQEPELVPEPVQALEPGQVREPEQVQALEPEPGQVPAQVQVQVLACSERWALEFVAASATWQCRPSSSAESAMSCSEEGNACYG
jgi:hypothetical protein